MTDGPPLMRELAPRFSPAVKWTVAIVGLLGANMLAMVFLIANARHGQSRVVPAYYERAIHYDDVLDQAARNRELGWNVNVAIANGVIIARAADIVGAPLTGARLWVEGCQRVGGRRIAGSLVETSPGLYQGRVGGSGWVDLSIAMVRANDRFARSVSVEAR